MVSEKAPIYLYRGDDTAFDGANVIQFVVSSDTTDLSRFSGFFQLGNYTQVGNISDGVMRVEIGREFTGQFLLGPMRGIFKLVDKLGRIKTVINDLNFYITDDLSLIPQSQSITVEGIDYQIAININVPLTQYADLKGKPSINGVELLGDKSLDDLGAQQKLIPGEHISLEDNIINVIVDASISADSEHPVQNKVVKDAIDNSTAGFTAHITDKNNPHEVSKAQVGLENVDNTSDIDKPVSTATQTALNLKQDSLSSAQLAVVNSGITSAKITSYDNHLASTSNPHSVTKEQVGLGNVDNTADLNKPVSTAMQIALDGKQANLTQEQLAAVNSGADSTKIANIAENAQAIATINGKIPEQASSSNKLADKSFVNSSIATNTAYFIGTFNSLADLEAYSGDLTNNDYAFVVTTDVQGNTVYNRYKYNAEQEAWLFEYALNNSSFTAAQWAAIQSGITAALVTSYSTHIADTDIHVTAAQKSDWNSKAAGTHTHTKSQITDMPTKLSDFTDDLGNSPTHSHSQYLTTIPVATTAVLGGVKPDGTTITVAADGTISSSASGGGGAPTLTWYTGNTGTTLTIVDTSSATLVKVYKNGILLQPGSGNDYIISGTTLTLETALIASDKITLEVF